MIPGPEPNIPHRPQWLTACNCSLCRRLGVLWAYHRPDQAVIVEGAGTTVPLRPGRPHAGHEPLSTCGCVTHWMSLTGADRIAVNARLMEERDIEGVLVRRFDAAESWSYLD